MKISARRVYIDVMADFTKDFDLVTLDLTLSTGEVWNLRFKMLEISVYEDIFNNNITADVVINDAENMLMNFPIFGYEELKLEFRTPDKGLWSKKLRLIKITDRELVRERELAYTLHFVTPEAVLNLKKRISKSYKGKLISQMVDDIHPQIGGGPVETEATKIQHHFVIPNLHPMHAINWLATHANPAAYKGASYLYYENKDTFKFVSSEKLLSDAVKKTYLYQVANVRRDDLGHKPQDLETNIIAAEAYTFDNHMDIIENMRRGMYGNELLTHSDARKIWRRYEFDYPGSFDDYKHLYPGNYLESKAKQDTNKKESKLKLHSTGHDQNNYPFLPELWIPCRISQLHQLHQIRLTITLPGDSERTCGDVVEFNLPSPEPPINNEQVDDKFYRGKYLVQSVRHIIDQDKYRTVLGLVKDSVFTAFP